MKLTKHQLKQLIKEELQNALQEQKVKQWERDHERKKVARWLKGIATQVESAQEPIFATVLPRLHQVVKFMTEIAK